MHFAVGHLLLGGIQYMKISMSCLCVLEHLLEAGLFKAVYRHLHRRSINLRIITGSVDHTTIVLFSNNFVRFSKYFGQSNLKMNKYTVFYHTLINVSRLPGVPVRIIRNGAGFAMKCRHFLRIIYNKWCAYSSRLLTLPR